MCPIFWKQKMQFVAAWNCLHALMADWSFSSVAIFDRISRSFKPSNRALHAITLLFHLYTQSSLTYRSQSERIRFKRFAVSCLTAERRPLHVSNYFNAQNEAACVVLSAAVCRLHDDVIFMYVCACVVVFIVVRAHSQNVSSDCMCLRRIDLRAWPSHTPRTHQICSKQTSSILSVHDCGCVSCECAPIDG